MHIQSIHISVMFHNSDDAVWSSLERAIEAADLSLESAIAFDKTQPSFKGVKQITNQERVSSFDLVLHLRAGRKQSTRPRSQVDEAVLINKIANLLATATPRRRTTPFIHSFVMRVLLENGWPLAGFSYRDVETLLDAHFQNHNGTWAIPTNEGAS